MSLKKNNETHANKVYNFLKKKNKPLSAYEILEELASQGITAPTTIYRALNKLVSNGLIHKIESLCPWHHQSLKYGLATLVRVGVEYS